MKLDTNCLQDSNIETISKRISEVIDEYNLWVKIKMIIADTDNVNNCKKSEDVIQLHQILLN